MTALPLPPAPLTGPPERPASERLQLLQRGAANYAGVVIPGAVSVLVVPVLLRGLGADVYAMWVATLAVATLVTGFDFGLGLAVTREVAAREADDSDAFVRTAGVAYALLALGGGAVAFLSARSAVGFLSLPPADRAQATGVVAAGVAFCTLQFLYGYTTATLQGLGRFSLVGSLNSAGALARAALVVALAAAHAAPVAILASYAVVQGAMLGASGWAISRRHRALAPRLERPEWRSLGRRVSFSLGSQAALLVNGFLVDTGPTLIVGRLLGAEALVALHIAQRIPLALSMVIGSLAGVLFPAARERAGDEARLGAFAATATSWMAIVLVGPTVALAVLTPDLLAAWVGVTAPATILLAQLGLLETYLIGLQEGILNALWALGRVRAITVLMAAAGVPALVLTWPLVARYGIVGAGIGGVLGTGGLFVLLLVAGRRTLGVRLRALLVGSALPIAVPLVASGAAALVAAVLLDGWAAAVVGGILSATAFAVALCVGPAARLVPEIRERVLGALSPILPRAKGA